MKYPSVKNLYQFIENTTRRAQVNCLENQPEIENDQQFRRLIVKNISLLQFS